MRAGRAPWCTLAPHVPDLALSLLGYATGSDLSTWPAEWRVEAGAPAAVVAASKTYGPGVHRPSLNEQCLQTCVVGGRRVRGRYAADRAEALELQRTLKVLREKRQYYEVGCITRSVCGRVWGGSHSCGSAHSTWQNLVTMLHTVAPAELSGSVITAASPAVKELATTRRLGPSMDIHVEACAPTDMLRFSLCRRSSQGADGQAAAQVHTDCAGPAWRSPCTVARRDRLGAGANLAQPRAIRCACLQLSSEPAIPVYDLPISVQPHACVCVCDVARPSTLQADPERGWPSLHICPQGLSS